VPLEQQFQCSNITCTVNGNHPFTKETEKQCLNTPPNTLVPSPDSVDNVWEGLPSLRHGLDPGPNSYLFNGMVAPFVNMTLRGWVWYQGENNLMYHAGNVIDRSGYACMLQTLIQSWRAAWSVEAQTTSPTAPFGIVMLADSTDEGWGCNVPQMHWAQTGNIGFAPNEHLPGTFFAAAHDLADPWDDNCWDGAHCCVDTGLPVDPRCGPHRGWLVQRDQYPGVTEPVTPTAGLTIHPRIKKQVGARLAQAAWSLVYGHDDVAWTGPVLSGCHVDNTKHQVVISFNSTLLKNDAVRVADYNKTEEASVMWVLMTTNRTRIPEDAWHNYVYVNRAPWWGDNADWVNVNIASGPVSNSVIAQLPDHGEVLAIKYGHGSPKGNPENGHMKQCCGNRNFGLDPCPPESCPLWSKTQRLPAMPFMAQVVNGRCQCLKPQSCDEDTAALIDRLFI